jgi:DNA-binding CsgD family transcriptional regulator
MAASSSSDLQPTPAPALTPVPVPVPTPPPGPRAPGVRRIGMLRGAPRKLALNDRDWTMIQMMADGHRYSGIAAAFGLKESYIKQVFQRIFDITGTWSMPELVAYGFRNGRLR